MFSGQRGHLLLDGAPWPEHITLRRSLREACPASQRGSTFTKATVGRGDPSWQRESCKDRNDHLVGFPNFNAFVSFEAMKQLPAEATSCAQLFLPGGGFRIDRGGGDWYSYVPSLPLGACFH